MAHALRLRQGEALGLKWADVVSAAEAGGFEPPVPRGTLAFTLSSCRGSPSSGLRRWSGVRRHSCSSASSPSDVTVVVRLAASRVIALPLPRHPGRLMDREGRGNPGTSRRQRRPFAVMARLAPVVRTGRRRAARSGVAVDGTVYDARRGRGS